MYIVFFSHLSYIACLLYLQNFTLRDIDEVGFSLIFLSYR